MVNDNKILLTPFFDLDIKKVQTFEITCSKDGTQYTCKFNHDRYEFNEVQHEEEEVIDQGELLSDHDLFGSDEDESKGDWKDYEELQLVIDSKIYAITQISQYSFLYYGFEIQCKHNGEPYKVYVYDNRCFVSNSEDRPKNISLQERLINLQYQMMFCPPEKVISKTEIDDIFDDNITQSLSVMELLYQIWGKYSDNYISFYTFLSCEPVDYDDEYEQKCVTSSLFTGECFSDSSVYYYIISKISSVHNESCTRWEHKRGSKKLRKESRLFTKPCSFDINDLEVPFPSEDKRQPIVTAFKKYYKRNKGKGPLGDFLKDFLQERLPPGIKNCNIIIDDPKDNIEEQYTITHFYTKRDYGDDKTVLFQDAHWKATKKMNNRQIFTKTKTKKTLPENLTDVLDIKITKDQYNAIKQKKIVRVGSHFYDIQNHTQEDEYYILKKAKAFKDDGNVDDDVHRDRIEYSYDLHNLQIAINIEMLLFSVDDDVSFNQNVLSKFAKMKRDFLKQCKLTEEPSVEVSQSPSEQDDTSEEEEEEEEKRKREKEEEKEKKRKRKEEKKKEKKRQRKEKEEEEEKRNREEEEEKEKKRKREEEEEEKEKKRQRKEERKKEKKRQRKEERKEEKKRQRKEERKNDEEHKEKSNMAFLSNDVETAIFHYNSIQSEIKELTFLYLSMEILQKHKIQLQIEDMVNFFDEENKSIYKDIYNQMVSIKLSKKKGKK